MTWTMYHFAVALALALALGLRLGLDRIQSNPQTGVILHPDRLLVHRCHQSRNYYLYNLELAVLHPLHLYHNPSLSIGLMLTLTQYLLLVLMRSFLLLCGHTMIMNSGPFELHAQV